MMVAHYEEPPHTHEEFGSQNLAHVLSTRNLNRFQRSSVLVHFLRIYRVTDINLTVRTLRLKQ